jgi:peptidoglycan/LPS O-acetylase OafA/YrhL
MYLLNETLLIKIILAPFFSSLEFYGLGKFGWILLYASYWIVLIPTSILMYRFVEYPFINMRARVEIWMVKRNAENN